MKILLKNLKPGELFGDPDFEADERAIYYNNDSRAYADNIEWLRPSVSSYVRDHFAALLRLNHSYCTHGSSG